MGRSARYSGSAACLHIQAAARRQLGDDPRGVLAGAHHLDPHLELVEQRRRRRHRARGDARAPHLRGGGTGRGRDRTGAPGRGSRAWRRTSGSECPASHMPAIRVPIGSFLRPRELGRDRCRVAAGDTCAVRVQRAPSAGPPRSHAPADLAGARVVVMVAPAGDLDRRLTGAEGCPAVAAPVAGAAPDRRPRSARLRPGLTIAGARERAHCHRRDRPGTSTAAGRALRAVRRRRRRRRSTLTYWLCCWHRWARRYR